MPFTNTSTPNIRTSNKTVARLVQTVALFFLLFAAACSSSTPVAGQVESVTVDTTAGDSASDETPQIPVVPRTTVTQRPTPVAVTPEVADTADPTPATPVPPTPAPATPVPPAPAPATPAPPTQEAPTPTVPPVPDPPAPPTVPPVPDPDPEPPVLNRAPVIDSVSGTNAGRTVTVNVEASDGDGDGLEITVQWPDGAIDTAAGPSASISHTFAADVTQQVTADVMVQDDRGATAVPGQLVIMKAIAEERVAVTSLTVEASASCFGADLLGDVDVRTLKGNGALLIDTNDHSPTVGNGGPFVTTGPGNADAITFTEDTRSQAVVAGLESTSRVELGASVHVGIDAVFTGGIEIKLSETLTRSGSIDETFSRLDTRCNVRVHGTVLFGSLGSVGDLPVEDFPSVEDSSFQAPVAPAPGGVLTDER